MLSDLQNKISTPFKPLSFNETRHLYYWNNRIVPKSVSRKVDEHCEKFDPNKIIYGTKTLIEASAAKQSRLRGTLITPHELKHEWQTTNKRACDLGHETHDYMEFYNGVKSPTTPQEKAGVKFLKWLLNVTYKTREGNVERRYEILFRELRMYSVRFNFAGTADLIIADKKLRTIVIGDYKTNKDLFKTYGYLKSPFDFLESHPYNKYQLQLSYYQLMFEEMTGIKVSARVLAYLKADAEYDKFNLEDFTVDLKKYLIDQQKTRHFIVHNN